MFGRGGGFVMVFVHLCGGVVARVIVWRLRIARELCCEGAIVWSYKS